MIVLSKAKTATTEDLTAFDGVISPQRAHFFPETYRGAKKGIAYPPHRLFEKCMGSDLTAYVNETPVEGKTAFLMSVGSQVWSHVSRRYPQKNDTLDYETRLPFVTMTQIYCGRIATQFAAHDHVSTDASACASSLKVMMDVLTLIRHHGFDRVIVGAIDDAVNNTQLNIFGESGVSLSLEDEEAGLLPSAFDVTNKKFRLGQGAGIAIFEKARDDMDTPLGVLEGAYTASERADNSIGQRQDGEGFRAAIEGALHDARLPGEAIGIVKTHGTGTDLNNVSEKSGLMRAGLGDFVATSFKPRIGHTMGASGLVETVLLLEELRDTGMVPAIANRTEKDPVFLSDPVAAPDGRILSLAAGMGNVYSAAVFSRP